MLTVNEPRKRYFIFVEKMSSLEIDVRETLAIFNQDLMDNGAGRVISLHCPIDNQKMTFPARGTNCMHAQTFDAKTAILRNLIRCPVCDKRIKIT